MTVQAFPIQTTKRSTIRYFTKAGRSEVSDENCTINIRMLLLPALWWENLLSLESMKKGLVRIV